MALYPKKQISFCIETLSMKNGRKLGALRMNEAGEYEDIPMAYLNAVTRNNTKYDTDDFVQQIVDEDAYVNKMVKCGTLAGEYGHPNTLMMDDPTAIARLLMVDEKSESHHITKLRTGPTLEDGSTVIYGNIKPSGPYGALLHQSFSDPLIDTAFSLRSIASTTLRDGIKYRKMKKLVTFDYVTAGGYEAASKRYSPSNESIEIVVTPGFIRTNEVAMEHFTNQEINEIFGTNEITVHSEVVTYIPGSRDVMTASGDRRSLFHTLIKE